MPNTVVQTNTNNYYNGNASSISQSGQTNVYDASAGNTSSTPSTGTATGTSSATSASGLSSNESIGSFINTVLSDTNASDSYVELSTAASSGINYSVSSNSAVINNIDGTAYEKISERIRSLMNTNATVAASATQNAAQVGVSSDRIQELLTRLNNGAGTQAASTYSAADTSAQTGTATNSNVAGGQLTDQMKQVLIAFISWIIGQANG